MNEKPLVKVNEIKYNGFAPLYHTEHHTEGRGGLCEAGTPHGSTQKKGAHTVHHYCMRHDTGRKIRVTVYSAFPTEDYSHTGGEGQ